jgi:radical SAM protein with 4Fe4S-binding SPASM domain
MSNIIFNSNCNRQCVYCFARQEDRENKQLSLDNLTIICDFLQRSRKRKVNVLGGEPSLHPEFDVFLEYLISRGFVVHVFTNGMISHSTLESLHVLIAKWQLTRQRLKFIINVNEEKYRPPKEKELQGNTFRELHEFSTLSFNIFERDCCLDFLAALITRHQLIPEIRLGLASPILLNGKGYKGNRFLAVDDYSCIAGKIMALSGLCRENAIDIVFDCGFPLCMFSDEEIGRLYKNKTQLKFVCHPIPDIDPDLNVFHCYPLSGYFPQKLTHFRHLKEIHSYFSSLLAKSKSSERAGIFETCHACEYRHRGMCAGGCKGHYLDTTGTRGTRAA